MDHAPVDNKMELLKDRLECLNPCFNGSCTGGLVFTNN